MILVAGAGRRPILDAGRVRFEGVDPALADYTARTRTRGSGAPVRALSATCANERGPGLLPALQNERARQRSNAYLEDHAFLLER